MIETCPSEAALRRFNDGRIDDHAEIDRITEHIGVCEPCFDKLESMAPCQIAKGLRESVSSGLNPDETELSEQEDDLQSRPGSVEQIISSIDSLFSDQQFDQSALGESRYQMIAPIGEGDFSYVFGALAEDRVFADHQESAESPDKLVGIKIPHAHKLTSYRHAQQFFFDCLQAQLLKHPGIQPVIEFGHWDETQLFLSKPLLQHPTMTRFARSSPRLTRDMMLSIFTQLVDAIQYAHQHNVIHRHLTPNNIHLVLAETPQALDGVRPTHEIKVVVSDFGFVLDSRYHFDLIESSGSKSPFDSPEAVSRKAEFVDQRADIYSLGKILKLLSRLTIDPHDQDRLHRIIDKSTFARRRDRYQTVSELKAALELV